MLKLLLSYDRHNIRREYIFRVVNVLLVFGIVILIVNAVGLFAPYTVVYLEKNLINEELDKIKNSDVIKRKKDFDVNHQHTMAEFNLLNSEHMIPTAYFETIFRNMDNGISINGYNFSKIESENLRVKIEIRGQAVSRDSLVNFVNNLKKEDLFEKVELPISSLTKEIEIPFSIILETADNSPKT